jgi:hypothetical protein
MVCEWLEVVVCEERVCVDFPADVKETARSTNYFVMASSHVIVEESWGCNQ